MFIISTNVWFSFQDAISRPILRFSSWRCQRFWTFSQNQRGTKGFQLLAIKPNIYGLKWINKRSTQYISPTMKQNLAWSSSGSYVFRLKVFTSYKHQPTLIFFFFSGEPNQYILLILSFITQEPCEIKVSCTVWKSPSYHLVHIFLIFSTNFTS